MTPRQHVAATRRIVRSVLTLATAIAVAGCADAHGRPPAAPSAAGSALLPSPITAELSPSPSRGAPGSASSDALGSVSITLDRVATFPGQPLGVDTPRDGSGRLFIPDQGGRIWIVRNGQRLDQPFLDIAAQVTAGGEQGLLGLAFHPGFPRDPRFYVYYTDRAQDQVVSEFKVRADNADLADSLSERQILKMADFAPNHNGGEMVFGPDGFLYIGTGDGGGGGDPQGNGQRLGTLLGKILRIDVDGTAPGKAYGIPKDNPFVVRDGAMPEIWLYGLRNPWRFSFDRANGDLWIGDVGQNRFEEIDVVRHGSHGGLNFGWNEMEGFHCYPGGEVCALPGLTLPVTEYGHDQGCSLTGGSVYRGKDFPALVGGYVFADFCSGNLWLIDSRANEVRPPRLVLNTGHAISSFGEDEAGELYATGLTSGELLRVVAR